MKTFLFAATLAVAPAVANADIHIDASAFPLADALIDHSQCEAECGLGYSECRQSTFRRRLSPGILSDIRQSINQCHAQYALCLEKCYGQLDAELITLGWK